MPNPILRAFIPLSALSMVAACNFAQTEPPPLEGAAIGGPFTLTDSGGKTVHWSDYDGKWRMVYFGYTYCPDVCPFDVQKMMQGYKAFQKDEPALAAELVPIFISVDPERDTPAAMAEFASRFPSELVVLNGTPEQVAEAAKNFSVYYEKGPVNDNGGYMMDHSRGAYLMDRQGKPIALLPVDESAAGVAAELGKWVN